MRSFVRAATVVSVLLAGVALAAWQQTERSASTTSMPDPPTWAYPVNPPPPTPPPGGAAPAAAAPQDDGQPKRITGSTVALTQAQIRDFTNVPDWHPDDHPQMPEIVVHGRKPDVRFGCGYCHYPNGRGRPENASVAGLPAAYIVQQMADYKNGLRKSSQPKMGPPALMLQLAKGATDDDVKAAAAYFSSLKWTQWIKVVEAGTVPKSRLAGGMYVPVDGGGTEPLGNRILEMPQDRERTELRDSQSPFIAYVPVGIKKGEALARNGGSGKTTQCSICHGAELKGLGPVPGLAGRSPSYTFRQLFDLKYSARNGVWADLMKPVVAKLSDDDLMSLAAYTASLVP
jgi:cytochrome c553